MKARFFALAALVLGLASCQKDFDGASTLVGGEVDFQLSVGTEEMTRANDGDSQYGYDSAFGAIDYLCDDADEFRTDWTEVDLRYTLEVYDANALNAAPVKDRQVVIVDKYEPVTFDLRLVPNREYQFVVFADFVNQGASNNPAIEAQRNIGLHHIIGNDLRDIKIKEDAINDETTDAYFASEKKRVENSAAKDIVLKRPYGKVRVIATDLAELNINVEPKSVEVEYEAAHPAAFNAVTGAIDATYEFKKYTSVYNDIKKTNMDRHFYTGFNTEEYKVKNANNEVRNTYMTLFTDYILAKGEQESIHFSMTVKDRDGKEIKTTDFYTDIPVQRNHLTTIVGNVLTTATEINVTIDDNFAKPGYNVETVFVSSARELQEALDAFKNGQVIIFEADIKGDVFVHQKQDVNVSIFGDGYKYDGSIKIHNGSNYNNGTLVIKNVNFETATESLNFIMPNEFGVENGVTRRYSNNVTVEKCSFTATGAARYTAVGVQAKSCKNVQVLKCTSTDMHSLIQAQSCGDDVVVKNCTVTGKNGVAFKQVQNAVVEHNTIVAEAYGIRFDGNIDNYGITVKDNIVTAAQPFIVRKMTGANNTIALQGENEFVSNDYQIVITNGSDDEAYSVPTGSYSLSGDFNDYFVYPNANQAAIDFRAALADDTQAEITLTEAVKCPSNAFEIYRDVVLNFNNVELNAGSTSKETTNSLNYALEIYNGDVNIYNANFTRAGIVAANGADVVFENGTINHKPERSSRYIFCSQSGSTITIKDGTFNNDRSNNSYFWADNSTIYVKGGNFAGVASTKKVVLTNGGQLIITGGTFNFDPTQWLAPGYKAVKSGSNWVVRFGEEVDGATVLNVEDATLDLTDVDYGTVQLGTLKNVTINGSENASVRFVTTADSVIENVTINDVAFEFVTGAGQNDGAFVVIDANASIEKLVIENCTIVGDNNKNSYGICGKNPNASIVVKNCNFSNLGYAVQATSGGGYKSLNVENCSFNNIISWSIMPQYGYTGDLTVNGCSFTNCDGLVKTGAFGGIFTFTNNTLTNTNGHDGKDSKCFEVNANGTAVVAGNTKDGAAWTPGAEQGLK